MSVRKRNEFLEDEGSEEDSDHGYDSDDHEKSRGAIGGRASKRRKTDEESENDSAVSDEGDSGVIAGTTSEHSHAKSSAGRFLLGSDFEEESPDGPDAEDDELSAPNTSSITKPRTPKSIAAAEKAARRSGVIYISRVPPFMKPQTLRHYLAPHASKGIGRIFLTPEDHASHLSRVKRGGNKKKSFTDGWVEFVSKTEAKLAAESLKGNIIGGKKGNFYHDDLWNMKYLKGYKWSHLTEQISNENAERAARLREEVRKTRKENKAFLEDVERGKMVKGIESKRKAKMEYAGAEGAPVRPARDFKQRKAQEREPKNARDPDQLGRVQGLIF